MPAIHWLVARSSRWPAELVSRTIADGTRTQALGVRTFAHLRELLDSIVTVTEIEIAAGVRLAAERSRLVVEPSGALGIAAIAFHAAEARLDPARRPDRRDRQRRQRRPWSSTASTSRRRSRPSADLGRGPGGAARRARPREV